MANPVNFSTASNPLTGSVLNVGKESKTQSAALVTANPDSISTRQSTQLTQGFGTNPNSQGNGQMNPPPVAADFYRNGQFAAGNTNFNDNPDGPTTLYQSLPRMLDERKFDEPASIRLIGKPSGPGVITSPNSPDVDLIPPFTKFFLESVQEGHTERSQIVETFGQFYVFFFGERPPIYTFSGTLLNTENINWSNDYRLYYDQFLRGTKCVENNARVVLTYSYTQLEGYILGTGTSFNSVNEQGVGFTFQLLVIDRKVLKLSEDFGILQNGNTLIPDRAFLDLLQRGLSETNASANYNVMQRVLDSSIPPAQGLMASPAAIPGLSSQYGVPLIQSPTGVVVTP